MRTFTVALLCTAFSLGSMLSSHAQEDGEGDDNQIALNRRATEEALTAYRAGNYAEALEAAERCIKRYQPAADKIEAILEQRKAEFPSGALTAEQKEEIYPYEILHDVATCLLVKASAAEKRGEKGKAADARAAVQKYPHARVRDKAGNVVRSPSEVLTAGFTHLSQ